MTAPTLTEMLDLGYDAPIEFDGPATIDVFGCRYQTISSGVQPSAPAAWGCFLFTFSQYVQGATQIAWRVRPHIAMSNGGFEVKARLATYPPTPDAQAAA